jgi:hypothetical protein
MVQFVSKELKPWESVMYDETAREHKTLWPNAQKPRAPYETFLPNG